MKKTRVVRKPRIARAARPQKPKRANKQSIKINIRNTANGGSSSSGGGSSAPYHYAGYQPAPQQDLSMLPEMFASKVLPTITEQINAALARHPAPVPHAVQSHSSTQSDAPAAAQPSSARPAQPAIANPSLDPKLRRQLENKAFSLREVNAKVGPTPPPPAAAAPSAPLRPAAMQARKLDLEPNALVPYVMRKKREPSFPPMDTGEVNPADIPLPFSDDSDLFPQPLLIKDAKRKGELDDLQGSSKVARTLPFLKDVVARATKPRAGSKRIPNLVLPEETAMVVAQPNAVVPHKTPKLPLFGIGIKRKPAHIAKEYLHNIELNKKKTAVRPNLEKKRAKKNEA